ncbi:MAG: peptidoglycan-binding protein, partial [Alphaproteobacteria bacterium]|nr:peptidoglycan-binding protein [Alphaproteobacteria bacterium]
RAALTEAEAALAQRERTIAGLDRRLRAIEASRLQELERYRSEFFGRLRYALGQRNDVQIVGDRFVFQAEVLFPPGSAALDEAGRGALRALARTLAEVATTIPTDLPWVLRVDGHTDRVPIATPAFPSNWELSAARAITVVRFLTAEGISARRLVAAGFAEHQPLDPGDDEIAYRRNRRIEIKLTER